MEKLNLMVLQTQRETIWINITNQQLDITEIWLKGSKKRYLKLEGFYEDIVKETIEEATKKYSTIRYFNSIEDFLEW